MHLRSVREVTGYCVQAQDGEIGHVEEFLIDTDGWNVRYSSSTPGTGGPESKVLISPNGWSVNWGDRQVGCGLSREQVKAGPEYDPQATADPAYEQALYGHYGRRRTGPRP